jgi:hypothetical protein
LAALLFCAVPTLARKYAPSFPRDGAKRILDNPAHPGDSIPDDMMAVWDVTWEKGKPTAMQEHRFDQVSVTLAEGAVKVTRPDNTWTIEYARLGSVHFESKGTVVAEEGVSDKPRRALVVEIKSYAEFKVDPAVARGLQEAKDKGIPGQFPREGVVKLFENDHLIVWDDTWPIGKVGPLHAHYHTVVGLFVEAGEPGPTSLRPVGFVDFAPPRIPPHTEPVPKVLRRAIFLEFK